MSEKKEKAKTKSFKRGIAVLLRRMQMYHRNPKNQENSKQLQQQAKDAESSLIKYILLMNSGAVVAALALIGQMSANINQSELVTLAGGVQHFLTALAIIGFGLLSHLISLVAVWGRFSCVYFLFRTVYLGLSFYAFYLFIAGTSAVTNALLAAV